LARAKERVRTILCTIVFIPKTSSAYMSVSHPIKRIDAERMAFRARIFHVQVKTDNKKEKYATVGKFGTFKQEREEK
jgi:hypothetical protein